MAMIPSTLTIERSICTTQASWPGMQGSKSRD
jgi:hypothetical protein